MTITPQPGDVWESKYGERSEVIAIDWNWIEVWPLPQKLLRVKWHTSLKDEVFATLIERDGKAVTHG